MQKAADLAKPMQNAKAVVAVAVADEAAVNAKKVKCRHQTPRQTMAQKKTSLQATLAQKHLLRLPKSAARRMAVGVERVIAIVVTAVTAQSRLNPLKRPALKTQAQARTNRAQRQVSRLR